MKKQYNFRLDTEIMEKLEKIAEDEERTLTQEITYLAKKRNSASSPCKRI